MIKFEKFVLENGLKIIVHEDKSSPLAAVNLLYDVGARDEDSSRTGFAHLFEHLMFGGSQNISDYDKVVQQIGGSNNAFTTNDITNYYLTIPSNNLETAFWLESDRMNQLDFSLKSLDIQRNVVVEEFKQRYLNQPYGDAMLLLRPLAYKTHPYLWATIGKEIAHIEDAKLKDVEDFFYKHYGPQNCILTVVGNVDTGKVKQLAQKWFGDIPNRSGYVRNLKPEPRQTSERSLEVEKDVPADSFYMTFHMDKKGSDEYNSTDLLSDVLSRGNSSRFNQELIKNQKLFGNIEAYVTGSLDPGMFIISGKLLPEVKMEEAEKAIWIELEKLKAEIVGDRELQKLKNKIESTTVFEEIGVLNKAMNLAHFELLGDANGINSAVEKYQSLTAKDLKGSANLVFRKENSSTLRYYSNK
ncbi:MAG: insulinase family protein [Flavobacteriales bacterium]|nr:insulinase family protein [Flavobacteriales bacterium]